jgi:uncharacterized membrane protein
MRKPTLPVITAAAIGLLAVVAFAIRGMPYFFERVAIGTPTATFGSQSIRGLVTAIVDEGQIEVDGRSQPYQVMRVQALEGEFQGVPFDVDYGKRNMRFDTARFAPGDEVYLLVNKMPDNTITAYYDDYVRTRPMLILFGGFVLSIVILGRWKGLRSLAALAFSMLMIIGYIVPHILGGENPVKVSLIGSMVLLGVTLYFTYGWNLKTHASVLSMVLTLAIAGGLAALFVELTRLTGYGDESSMFLMQFSSVKIDPRGLLLGGMIIGSLGVLDDLVTSQSAAVVEIHDAKPALGFRGVFQKAMRIGQDHVAATVNTLVLAYTGASLPLLLMFTLAQGSYGYLLNSEYIAEEVVRTLVGSLALMAAVPISTLLATTLIVHQSRLGDWRPLLGPVTEGGEAHVH